MPNRDFGPTTLASSYLEWIFFRKWRRESPFIGTDSRSSIPGKS